MKYISSLPSLSWQKQEKTVAILGSTGSIGCSALRVIRNAPYKTNIIALAGGKNLQLLAQQAIEFKPPFLAIQYEHDIPTLSSLLPSSYTPTIVYGSEGYAFIASLPEVSTVLCAQVGASGLHGTYHAIAHGKVVALANKESLVLAGSLLRSLAQERGACIIPVDSEHSALLQCLQARPTDTCSKLILTASGGPFRNKSYQELQHVTPHDALQHPTWKMGAKISIDSATMMNKGLEIIEAYHLFGIEPDKITAIIHPQSIIHALVEFNDSAQIAQLSIPSMDLAIAYALYYPHSYHLDIPSLSLSSLQSLTFEEIPSSARCYHLAKEVLSIDENLCIILNGANEIAVEHFLLNNIPFTHIPLVIESILEQCNNPISCTTLDDILHLDQETRILAQEYIATHYTKTSF